MSTILKSFKKELTIKALGAKAIILVIKFN